MPEIPTTYVFGWIGSAKFHAKVEFYEDIVQGMRDGSVVEIIDVDDERGAFNCAHVDSVYISTPDSREASRAFFEQENEDYGDGEKKEPWEIGRDD